MFPNQVPTRPIRPGVARSGSGSRAGIMSRMSRRKRARGRHSRVTPDPKSPVDRDRKGRASLAPTTLLDLCDCPGCEPGAVGDDESGDLLSLAELLENISAEDFRRLLVDLDASAELQNAGSVQNGPLSGSLVQTPSMPEA